MIFENHHEPIIDTQTWERVQELRKQRKRPNRYDEVGLFSGILFCADCGSVMYQQRYQTDKRKQDCYICGNYKKRTHDCTAHFIRTDEQSRTRGANAGTPLRKKGAGSHRETHSRVIRYLQAAV